MNNWHVIELPAGLPAEVANGIGHVLARVGNQYRAHADALAIALVIATGAQITRAGFDLDDPAMRERLLVMIDEGRRMERNRAAAAAAIAGCGTPPGPTH